MVRRAMTLTVFAALVLVSATGCGGGVQKGANQDKDRPKPTSK